MSIAPQGPSNNACTGFGLPGDNDLNVCDAQIAADAERVFSSEETAKEFFDLFARMSRSEEEVPGAYCRRALRLAEFILRSAYAQSRSAERKKRNVIDEVRAIAQKMTEGRSWPDAQYCSGQDILRVLNVPEGTPTLRERIEQFIEAEQLHDTKAAMERDETIDLAASDVETVELLDRLQALLDAR